jgi:DNA-binding NarL/FixJ family response regulator
VAGVAGGQFSEILRESRPDFRVMFVSGYPHEALGQHATVADHDGYLPEPFTPHDLVKMAGKVFDYGDEQMRG